MLGPAIVARTLSVAALSDKFDNVWQYLSRSDHHSKVACWAVLFDLVSNCPTLAKHIEAGRVGFGINHEMRDFKSNRPKNLDLVVCTPRGDTAKLRRRRTFRDLVKAYGIVLDGEDERAIDRLPQLMEVQVGSVHVALEAKACMTAHIKAIPRLYDELMSSYKTIHGCTDTAVAVGFVMVNVAEEFVSTDRNKHDLKSTPPKVSEHHQPKDALRVIGRMRDLPRRTRPGEDGFDALGIVAVKLRNDGSPMELVTETPAVPPGDIFHYDQMIHRAVQAYESRFGHI